MPYRQRQPDEEEIVIGRHENIGLLIAIIGLALTFLVQFGGSIWWGATLSADLRHVTESLARMETERYSKSDAARDAARMDQRLDDVVRRIARIEQGMDGKAGR